MNRIYLYSGLYIITLIIYVFFNSIGGFDTLVFFIFIISSIVLVFAREELPNPEFMKFLEVKQYQEKRVNIFGYAMSTMLIVSSLLFSLLTLYFKLNIGLTSLIIWPVLILLTVFFTDFLSKKSYDENLLNYLVSKVKLEKTTLKKLADYLIKNMNSHYTVSELEDRFIKEFSNSTSIPILHETFSEFVKYIDTQSNNITSDEISEVNKGSK